MFSNAAQICSKSPSSPSSGSWRSSHQWEESSSWPLPAAGPAQAVKFLSFLKYHLPRQAHWGNSKDLRKFSSKVRALKSAIAWFLSWWTHNVNPSWFLFHKLFSFSKCCNCLFSFPIFVTDICLMLSTSNIHTFNCECMQLPRVASMCTSFPYLHEYITRAVRILFASRSLPHSPV